MSDPTRDEICVVAVAECFRGDGERLCNPIGTIPMIGGRLARESFEPHLVMTDGFAMFAANAVPVGVPDPEVVLEAWNPYPQMFSVLWNGKRHVMMGASQMDPYGNQNFACIGDWHRPKAQLLGFRGAPGNTINHTTSYFIPNHTPKVFVDHVDVVCGIGYDRAAELGPVASRFHEIRRVVSNLGTFDFETPDRRMRLRTVHPGVTVDDIVEATGFELVIDEFDESRLPTDQELRLIREVIDPNDTRKSEVRGVTHAALRTRACELFGVEYPIVQTGMGWVAGARLTSATSAAGGLGILASATMTYDQLRTAITEVKERTDKPFGVNLRADQPDIGERLDLLIREGVRVASFAQAPSRDVIAKLKDAGVVTMPTVGARRHAEKVAEWGVDAVIAQGAEGGGHTGVVPTSLLLPQVVDTVDIPVLGAGGFTDGRGLVAALSWGASGIAMGTRFLLTKDSTVPDSVKQVYLSKSVTDTVVTTAVDGYPQRVIRTDVVDELERSSLATRLPRAVRRALEFRKLTGTSYRALLSEGLAMKRNQDLSWSQLAMAANAPMLIKATMVDGHPEVGILPTGQGIGVIDELPTVAELIERIVTEAEAVLGRLSYDS